MKTAIYLRKSRADEEAEKQGEYETLSRHRSTLLKTAKEKKLNIVEIKEEVLSGESVAHRPKMLELLEEVKNKKYDAVLVMDIDRLGRGNMQDQGLILDTFKQSKTKIITPRKVYDLSNEWDEEYSEFEAFMARKELKLITRRMQRGRIKSVEEGKFIAQSAPFGYKVEYINNAKDRILVIDEEKSEIVKLIFDKYLNGIGAYKIANRLNSLGYRTTTGRTWYEKAIRDIIKNKTYCGYVVWNKVERKRNSSRVTPEREICIKGKHQPIISEEKWLEAQEIRTDRRIAPVHDNKVLTNPLAGLVKCNLCGASMTAATNTYKDTGSVKFIRCKNCYGVGGCRLDILEEEVLNRLKEILVYHENNYDNITIEKQEDNKIDNLFKILNTLEKESVTLSNQKEKLHDFLERGVYDVDTYLDRSKTLTEKIENNMQSIEEMKLKIKEEKERATSTKNIIPAIREVIENYEITDNISAKNKMLKSVIDNIVYYKPKIRNHEFELDIKLKL